MLYNDQMSPYECAAQDLRHSQRARAILGLADPLQVKALELLMSPGPWALIPEPRVLNISELCRYWGRYSDSSIWGQLCEVWQVAVESLARCIDPETLKVVGLQAAGQPGVSGLRRDTSSVGGGSSSSVAQNGGVGPGNGAVSNGISSASMDNLPAAEPAAAAAAGGPMTFRAMMEGPVASLCRKPVRVSFGLRQLQLAVEVEAALRAIRDYCERVAREFDKNAKG